MKIIIKIWIFLICLAGCAPLYALQQRDSIYIYFKRGYAIIDPSIRNNHNSLESFITTLDKLNTDPSKCHIKIHIKGNASPDGSISANMKLTKKRVDAIIKYIKNKITIPDSLISVTANGIDWDGLIHMVENDMDCPAKNEILNIIHNTPELIYDDKNHIVDGRKKQLMDLNGGIPYNYLSEKLFPELRNTHITLYYEIVNLETTCTEKEKINTDLIICDSTYSPASKLQTAINDIITNHDEETTALCNSDSICRMDYNPLYKIALKTNLLHDIILMPSAEIEYRINDRWSIAIEGSVAWWKNDNKHKYYQIATIIPEGRYWFKTKNPWHGHYFGFFAGGSWYDLENGGRGYKGEFFTTGISYGYMFPINRTLSFDTGIGIGVLHTVYEEYLPIDGHYVYQQTSRTNWLGPVRLKLSLVWKLWDQNK